MDSKIKILCVLDPRHAQNMLKGPDLWSFWKGRHAPPLQVKCWQKFVV